MAYLSMWEAGDLERTIVTGRFIMEVPVAFRGFCTLYYLIFVSLLLFARVYAGCDERTRPKRSKRTQGRGVERQETPLENCHQLAPTAL